MSDETDLKISEIDKITATLYLVSWYAPNEQNIGIVLKPFTSRAKAVNFMEENGIPETAMNSFELTWDLLVFTYGDRELILSEEVAKEHSFERITKKDKDSNNE